MKGWEGQASSPVLGFGGVHGGGGEVKKGVFGGNPWVGGGDGKIIPPVWLGDLPAEGEDGVIFPFMNVKFMKGNMSHPSMRVTRLSTGNTLHIPSQGLPCP